MNFLRKAFVCLLTAALLSAANPAYAIDPSSATKVFTRIATASVLRNPSVAVIDASTGELIYQSNGDSQRKPASVMKILSATATLKYLDPAKRYSTRVFSTNESGTVVLQGDLDPWYSLKVKEGKKMHRTSIPTLASHIQSSAGADIKKLTVKYSGLYSKDIANLAKYFKSKKIKVTWQKVAKATGTSIAVEEKYLSTSPTIQEITHWFLTWSDNVLAERLARQSAKAAGYSFDEYGVSDLFKKILTDMEIDPSALNIHDASGLSKENKITAKLMAQLLFKIHKEPAFAQLISGLPVSGVSGTLSKRYLDSAPEAVGLVKAKTGTLNGTISMAGYVESGDREYVFVVLADRIAGGTRAANKARETLDSYLGQIAKPLSVQATIQPVMTSGSQTP
jgi:D-alanyl-D-alanine carboxypeptidase